MIITADHILPVSDKPIKNGAVVVNGDLIEAVGELSQIAERYPGEEIIDLGNCAVLPGFVNCHSHLEITAMRGALDSVEQDFRSWLLKLNSFRAMLSDEEIRISADAGAIEAARSGVTCMGDIGRFGRAGFEALKAVGLRGILFQETEFSPDDRTALDDIAELWKKMADLQADSTELVEIGISPHSPYTVSRKLFEKIAELVKDQGIKVSIHAAESRTEDELLKNGQGFFIDVYKKFDVEWNSPRVSPIEFLHSTGILETSPLLVHCVTVSDEDISMIAKSGSSIAHCPRSNAKFGHGFAPLEKFISAGIDVGFGSDSVASNNTCDIIEEARFAAFAARNISSDGKFITAENVLEIATLGGAKALGLDEKIGTIESGKHADLTAVSLSNIAQQPISDIVAAIVFSSNARDVVMTMVDGKIIYRDGKCLTTDEAETINKLADIAEKFKA